MARFEDLLQKTITDITVISNKAIEDDQIIFTLDTGKQYRMRHWQDCCECVVIEDIIGDLSDLLHTPILMAEEVEQDDSDARESATWTFYKLATIKGYVTIRWYGTSNGYYSESVDFEEL